MDADILFQIAAVGMIVAYIQPVGGFNCQFCTVCDGNGRAGKATDRALHLRADLPIFKFHCAQASAHAQVYQRCADHPYGRRKNLSKESEASEARSFRIYASVPRARIF